jgi:hypothetical protein
MSKYKPHYTVKLRMAHYISYGLFDDTHHLDNRGNSRANTCTVSRLLEGMYLLGKSQPVAIRSLVTHDNFANRMALRRRWFIQISALSTFDGRIEAYHGFNG